MPGWRALTTACCLALACRAAGNDLLPLDETPVLPLADEVVVYKGARTLVLVKDSVSYREYRIALGANPKGHKWQEGDKRTPEGRYVLEWRNPESRYYRSIRISYPNGTDRAYARMAGVDPGGNIMIHGLPDRAGWASDLWDWTDGCIAVSNQAMDEIWAAVTEGTPIEIRP